MTTEPVPLSTATVLAVTNADCVYVSRAFGYANQAADSSGARYAHSGSWWVMEPATFTLIAADVRDASS